MTARIDHLASVVRSALGDRLVDLKIVGGEATIVVDAQNWLQIAETLRDAPGLKFDTLIDVCGLDYLGKKSSDWRCRIQVLAVVFFMRY